METLQQMPALVMLERLPVPVLAVAEDGTILFANAAFGSMLDYPVPDVLAMNFRDLFQTPPGDDSAVSVVRAMLSRSALLRGDDPVALATFQDLTERLWVDEK